MKKTIAVVAAALALAAPASAARVPAWYGPWANWVVHHKQGPRPAAAPAKIPQWAWKRLRRQLAARKHPAPKAPAGRSAAALNAAEHSLADAVNTARSAQGLRPLAIDDRLQKAAREHGADLLSNHVFTHDFLRDGAAYPFATWIAWYYPSRCAGENLAEGQPGLSAAKAVQMWLESPGHRANMLSGAYTTMGVALSSATGTTVAVNVFGGC